MRILNNLSIKFRVLFLILVPLVALLFFSYLEVKSSRHQINDLSSVELNLKIGNKLFNNASIMDNLRLASLHDQAIKLDSETQIKWKINNQLMKAQINKLSHLFYYGDNNKQLILIQNFSGAIGEIDDMINDIESYKIDNLDNVVEWSDVSFNDLIFNTIGDLESMRVHTDSPKVNQKMNVIIQLRWIMYYTVQENWFIQLMLTQVDDKYVNQLEEVSIGEEIFIGRFLSQNATEQQINDLLKIFQSNAFQKSNEYKKEILQGRLYHRSKLQMSKIEKILTQRVTLMTAISNKIITNTNSEISANIEAMKTKIYFFIGAIIALIFFITLVGFNLANRIFKYLKTVIRTLEAIEEHRDYSIVIPSDGKDEFSLFSSKLNVLISERKINEDKMIHAKEIAEKANLAKSLFLANMSHEIRTPLNGILGMHQILLESKLTSSQQNHLDTIEQSSKTLLIIINDILDISKIESGNLHITKLRTNFRETIFEVLAIVLPQAVEKKLLLEAKISTNLPARLNIDEQRIRQVIMNLLSNAIKFTQQGKVVLNVNGKIKDDNYSLEISISDTGIGIANENQDSIFNPFEQEDGSITRKFGGTGLGLSISQQLVNLMGGEIKIDSEKGKGSCFYFVLDCEIITLKREYKAVKALKPCAIILVNNGQDTADAIKNELAYFKIDIHTEIESIQMLNLDDERKKDGLLIYCQDQLALSQNEINAFSEALPHVSLLLVQSSNNEQFDFRNQVNGQVVVPLLGERFIDLLVHASAVKLVNEVDKDDDADNIKQEIKDVCTLVVEDNLVNQKVVTFFLKGFGFKFEIAENGLIALNKIKEGFRPDVILMDCMMPEMDGFTATEEIRKFELSQGIDKIPIIALTASVFDEDIKHCYNSGMDDYLSKPINKELLKIKLMAALTDGGTNEPK
ncbi:MAG: response regulator [Psychromonas sp.]|nr:response regulator [Psychromonas sp.]